MQIARAFLRKEGAWGQRGGGGWRVVEGAGESIRPSRELGVMWGEDEPLGHGRGRWRARSTERWTLPTV